MSNLISFFVSISTLGFFVGILINPKIIYFSILVLLIIFFSLAKLYSWKLKSKNFWYFLITPFLFFISSILFFIFLEGHFFLKCIIISLFVVLQWFIYKNIFFLLKKPEKYQPNTIRNIFNFINLISIFFFANGFYALIIFIGIPVWLLTSILFLIVFLYLFQFFWINKIPEKKALFFALILGLVFIEIFFIISFLPTSFYVNGLILTLIYFNIKNISKKYFLNSIKLKDDQPPTKIIKREVIQYLIINILILALILGTAQYH
ncbi:MAG: hypothetical protein ABH808_01640 [Candidatus Kuenenbacteria bacterium]